MKYYNALLIAFIGLLFIRCNKDIGVKEGSDITDKIVVKISEVVENKERNIFISATTKEYYPCANYTIATDFNSKKSTFNFNYKKIIIPTACLDAFGPAYHKIAIGTLSNGTYNLELHVPNGKNNGVLKVTDDNLQLIFTKIEGIEIPEPIIKRVR